MASGTGNNTIKVGITAELNNYKNIVEYIIDGIEKGLVDGVSEKALQKVINRISTTFEQLKLDNFEAAFDSLEKIGNSLLTISESINVAAGAAESNIAEVNAKLNETRHLLADLQKNNPKGRYRELTDSQNNGTGQYVRSKAGLQRELVGINSEEQWKAGQATFTGAKGETVNIDYGGKTWSINSAVSNLVTALNEGTLALNKEIQDAIKEFGYTVAKNQEGKYVADRQNLTAERANNIRAWEDKVKATEAQIEQIQSEAKEATANVETVHISAETGEFETPNLKVVQSQDNLRQLEEAYTKSTVEQNKATHQQINAAEAARDAQDKLAAATKNVNDEIKQQPSAVGKAVTTFFGYQMVIRQLRKLWNEAIHTITELDKQLTNQAIVTDLTREQTWQLVSTYQDLANQAGVTQTEIAGVTTEYLRQGETLTNALTLTKAATAAATVAGISASDSVKYLTTAVHGFKLEAEDALAVSDKFAALAAQAATNYEDLAVALSKVASQAELAGMSMDYTLALLTTGLDVTQEAPESIGTALKTVIARMREISDYGKTLEDDTNLNQVEAGLKAVGIELRNGIGELRSTENVLDELGRKWQDLSANQQAAVAKALAGTRQQSRLVAIMENYDDVIKNMNVAQNSLGATTAQQVKYLEGMEAAMNRLQNAYQTLIEGVIKSDLVIGAVNFITAILQQIQKFFNNPLGRTALVTGLISLFARSKEFMEKIRSGVEQLMQALSGVQDREQEITKEKAKQLELNKQLLRDYGLKERADKAGFGKTERPNGWLSNRPGTSNLADLFNAYLNPKNWGKEGAERRSATFQSWKENNSLLAKWQEHRAEKQLNKDMITTATEQGRKRINQSNQELLKAEQELAKAREETKRASEAAEQADEAYQNRFDSESNNLGNLKANKNKTRNEQEQAEKAQLEIEQKVQELRAKGKNIVEQENKTLKMMQSRTLTNEEKATYLSLQRTLEEQDQKLLSEDMTDESRKQLELDRDATRARMNELEQKGTGVQTGGKMAKFVGKASAIASAAAIFGSMLISAVDTFKNRYKEAADKAVDKATEIQSKIYNNTQTMTTLQTLGEDLRQLDRQVVKSADTMQKLNDTRQQLLEELALNASESKAYTNQQLYDKAMAKRAELENKNNELLGQLGDTLLGAANNYDFGGGALNILTKTIMGGGALMSFGPVATAVGAAAGLIVGAFEEISKAIAANDAKGKVHEMLQSDEGVNQMQYYLKAVYKNTIDTTTLAGEQLANSVKTTYASLMDSLSGDDIEKLLNQYNWNMDNLSSSIAQSLQGSSKALTTLTSDTAKFQERTAAATELFEKLNAESEVLGQAFLQQYGSYVQLGELLGGAVQYMDQFKWSMADMNDLLSQLADDGWTAEHMADAVTKLGEAMKDGTLTNEELTAALGDMSNAAKEAAVNLINGGMTMQELADQFTLANNTVNTIRDTQAKWGSMSTSDRQRFIDENEDFFNIAGAREAFYNGEDITDYIEKYKKTIQDGLLETTSKQIMMTEAEIYRLEAAINQTTDKAEKERLEKQLETTKRTLLDLHDTYSDVQHMFDLTLSQVVDKQNQQISKIKEMYQAEEKALTDSLNKRKEAYQKYFADIASQEAAADYGQNRDQLIESISRLSAGTDSSSRNKVNELRKQLVELEKQEAKRQTDEARQQVIENIDSQIKNIQENFEQLLNNNQALLASMDENTEVQYLNYLATLGLTDEDFQLRAQELGDLLKGRWTTGGRENFNDITIDDTPQPQSPTTEKDPTSVMNLSIAGQTEKVTLRQEQMKDLITEMFRWLNANAGTHFVF